MQMRARDARCLPSSAAGECKRTDQWSRERCVHASLQGPRAPLRLLQRRHRQLAW